MKTKRIFGVIVLAITLVLMAGCDISMIDNNGLRVELETVINGYGQGLVNNDVNAAMSHISYSYFDADGKDYAARKADVIVALMAGDYLDYNVSLRFWKANGDTAVASGELTTMYRIGTSSAVVTKTVSKDWTFRRENGRWRIQSEKAQ